MRLITTRVELVALARVLGVRPDWHEPDEQGVTADTFGRSFDTAGFWPLARQEPGRYDRVHTSDPERSTEIYVVLYRAHEGRALRDEPQPVAAVNLAMLFAWATGYQD